MAVPNYVKALAKFIEENLDENDQGRVHYLTSDSIVGYLDKHGAMRRMKMSYAGIKFARRSNQSILMMQRRGGKRFRK